VDGALLGFAMVRDVAGYAHLEEIDVLPAYGSLGIGAALLVAVRAWSAAAGYPAVTLRTFRDVLWNAPFYAKQGFQVIETASLSEAHVALEGDEYLRGLRMDMRVTMISRTKA